MTERLWAQMEQRFASEVFWHFVGRECKNDLGESYQKLIRILENGLDVGKNNIEFKYLDNDAREIVTLWGYPVSCLADIPFKDLHIHATRYGTIAIGFNKDSAIDNNFNPVLYVNTYSYLFTRFMKHRKELEEYMAKGDKEKFEKFEEMLLTLGSLAKSGDLKANPIDSKELDEFQLNNFYYEREWRSVYPWKFKSSDVALIIVNDDQMVKDLRNDIETKQLRIDKSTPILPFRMVYKL
jgi:hypothetical protein